MKALELNGIFEKTDINGLGGNLLHFTFNIMIFLQYSNAAPSDINPNHIGVKCCFFLGGGGVGICLSHRPKTIYFSF